MKPTTEIDIVVARINALRAHLFSGHLGAEEREEVAAFLSHWRLTLARLLSENSCPQEQPEPRYVDSAIA